MAVIRKWLAIRIVGLSVAVLLMIWAAFAIGPYRLYHSDYLLWSLSGRPCTEELAKRYIYYDPNASALIKGLNERQILKRFPFAVDASTCPENDHRRLMLEIMRNDERYRGKSVQMLWLLQNSSLAILVVDGKGERLGWFKG